ncbi:hypothetical protein SAMN05421769_0041 [Chryseobacterium scophthalmum]|uniref:Uncharacterized protein n=1 Tax=Chryseobacterium scophthalmum TaxID=59733 RepID=A0A1N6E9E7_9FLAO|nr:hypothetical protein SAMN05421769_0041 [Chryseobacterium scophthalmum]
MKALFTKQLFILFNLPILIFIILLFFINKDTIDAIGFNRKIGWNIWDKYLGNSLYNFSVFVITYFAYPLGYFIIALIRRSTNLYLSLIHFTLSIINLILLCINPQFYILIPISIICFIIFIFNIFKTTKIYQQITINYK